MSEKQMQRLEEAGEWIVRLQEKSLPGDEIAEWVRWCEANPENLQAFERLQGGWDALDALKSVRMAEKPKRVWDKRALTAGLGAAACAAIIAVALFVHDRSATDRRARALKEVTASEVNRSAMLPDGSSVVLSAKTFVTVNYNGAKRHLELSKGEAFFKVKADRMRPFVVAAGDVKVTALGTAFDVRHDDDRIVVTVEEGIVEVSGESAADGTAENRWRATAGYQIAWDQRERTAKIALVDSSSTLKWREGQLAYLWEPLGLVIDDLNHHSQQRIVIRDPSIADLRYTGNVIPAAIEDWVAAITATYPVRAVPMANGDIALETSGQ